MNREEELLKFSSIIDEKVTEMQFGELTSTVILKDGIPILPTLNIVKRTRIRYTICKDLTNSNSML